MRLLSHSPCPAEPCRAECMIRPSDHPRFRQRVGTTRLETPHHCGGAFLRWNQSERPLMDNLRVDAEGLHLADCCRSCPREEALAGLAERPKPATRQRLRCCLWGQKARAS